MLNAIAAESNAVVKAASLVPSVENNNLNKQALIQLREFFELLMACWVNRFCLDWDRHLVLVGRLVFLSDPFPGVSHSWQGHPCQKGRRVGAR